MAGRDKSMLNRYADGCVKLSVVKVVAREVFQVRVGLGGQGLTENSWR